MSELAGERVLHVAQHGSGWRARVCALESGTCVGVAGSKCLQPALGFFAEVVERGRGVISRGMDTFLRSAESAQSGPEEGSYCTRTRGGWEQGSLAADRRSPSARWGKSRPVVTRCQMQTIGVSCCRGMRRRSDGNLRGSGMIGYIRPGFSRVRGCVAR